MKYVFIFILTCTSLFLNAQLLAEWNFNSRLNDNNLTTGSIVPNSGTGIITSIGSVTNLYGDADGSSDRALTDNTGYFTSSYPNAGEANKSAGIEFSVNTVGYSNIIVKFNIKCAPDAANRYIVQYATDGIAFTDYHVIRVSPDSAAVFLRDNVVDLSAVSGINNNPNVKFRVVSAFDEIEGNYVAVNHLGNGYSSTGTVTFDMLSVTSTGVLPVNLSSFTGSYTNKSSLLTWITSTEININKYAIERSVDGRTFTEIGFVNATGNSRYSFVDATAKAAVNFYRLRIVGLNENRYSAVVKVLSDTFGSKLNVYPSPAVSTVNAEFTNEMKASAIVQFLDVNGRIILQKTMLFQQGYNNLSFDVDLFNRGAYILKIRMENKTLSSSFIKL